MSQKPCDENPKQNEIELKDGILRLEDTQSATREEQRIRMRSVVANEATGLKPKRISSSHYVQTQKEAPVLHSVCEREKYEPGSDRNRKTITGTFNHCNTWRKQREETRNGTFSVTCQFKPELSLEMDVTKLGLSYFRLRQDH